jgi:hypothetical protein
MVATKSSVYITGESLIDSLDTTTWTAFESSLDLLDTTIKEYNRSDVISVECPNDLSEYGSLDRSIEDVLFDISGGNWDQYQLYLNEVNQVTLPFIKYNNTEALLALINNQDDRTIQLGHFPRHYALTLKPTTRLQGIADGYHTLNWSETLSSNSKYISAYHEGSTQFILWSKENYEHLDFHDDVEQSLGTIQIGSYIDYSDLLSHSLDTLNQAFYSVSDNPAHNQQDLNTISTLAGNIGLKRNLDCTRQGSNKPDWDFDTPPKVTPKIRENINCEYHMKIDNKDDGTPIPRGIGNLVRVYFGLKSYAEYNRKQFKIAHLGKHL